MKTIDTREVNNYSPLIPAICAICKARSGEKVEIIMGHEEAFKDMKEYLSEQNIGFREIYDEDTMRLQFTITQ